MSEKAVVPSLTGGFLARALILTLVITVTLMAAMITTLVFLVEKAATRLDELTPACTVTRAFDLILTTQIQDRRRSLTDGTYDKLVKQGVFTPAHLNALRADMDTWRDARKQLLRNRC